MELTKYRIEKELILSEVDAVFFIPDVPKIK